MVAYSFKPAFAADILAGGKRQTIRQPRGGRGRHARVNDGLQLYTGMRTRQCCKLGDALCTEVREVVLDFAAGRVTLDDAVEITGLRELDAFATADGFGVETEAATHGLVWCLMRRWWWITHPGQPVFLGVLIGWGETFRPMESAVTVPETSMERKSLSRTGLKVSGPERVANNALREPA